ncbi:YbaN family protein [Seleniivibrio woodruffii]|uniref:YbaN family protein n=1 Tax=Seleniivibrio woodruffii TaxID=1078050 RepID=UPI0026EA3BAE|nr:YbaN family protein [Seleniivibrio woodruffii]
MKKGLLIFSGSLFTLLGLVGVFVPVLPTTPFLLLASVCYAKSSERLNNWLVNHRIFGAYIGSYMKYRAVRKDMKIRAVLFLWGSLILSALIVQKIHVAGVLFAVGIGVTVYIVSLKTMTDEMEAAAETE